MRPAAALTRRPSGAVHAGRLAVCDLVDESSWLLFDVTSAVYSVVTGHQHW